MRRLIVRLKQGQRWSGRMMLQHPGGRQFPAHVTTTPVYHEGELVGIVGLTTDLTEQEAAAQEREGLVAELGAERKRLKRLLERAEEASRIKTEFLSVVSHELRTPLTAVIGFAELMQMGVDGAVSEAQHERLDRIIENSIRLRDLVDEILEYARTKADPAEPIPTQFNAVEVAREAIESYEPAASRKGVNLSLRADGDDVEVWTDRDRVRRLVMNLVSNATKFTAEGSVAVTVTSDDDWFRYTVEDTGPGMAAEELERAFQAFVQVDQSATRSYGGIGLGLAVVQRVSDLLGGELSIDTAPGAGMKVDVRLPRRVDSG